MTVNIPLMLQGLGATVTAFDDPRQSLLMSQGVFHSLDAEKERRRRAAERQQEMELQRRRVAAMEAKQQLADMQYAQQQQQRLAANEYMKAALEGAMPGPRFAVSRGPAFAPTGPLREPVVVDEDGNIIRPPTRMSAPSGPPMGVTAPLGAPMLPASMGQQPMRTVQAPPPPGADETYRRLLIGSAITGDDRLKALAEAMAPHDITQKAQALADMSPEQRKALLDWRRAGSMQSNIYTSKNAGRPNSLEFDQLWGEAPKDMRFQRDAQGRLVMEDRYNEITRSSEPVPKLVALEPEGERSAEATKVAASVASGLAALDTMANIDTRLDNTWGAGTRTAFALNFPNTEGGRYRKELEDALDVLIRLRTGAAATESERVGMRAIYMPSFIAGAEERTAQREHLRRSIQIYEDFRNRRGYAKNKPLTDAENEEVLAEIDAARAQEGLGPGLRQVDLPIPPSRAVVPGAKFVGYDVAQGLYLYMDEQGNMIQRRVVRQE